MATTFTSRFGLRKPDPNPVTGDFVDVALDLNANWDKVDAAIDTICTSSTRPSTGLFIGKQCYETDTRRFIVCTQVSPALWVHPSANLVNVVSNITTEITTPYFNQIVHFQPDGCLYRYNGSSWIKYQPPADAVGGEYRASGAQTMTGGGLTKINFGATITTAVGITWNGTNQFTTLVAGQYAISAMNYMPFAAGFSSNVLIGSSSASLVSNYINGIFTSQGITSMASSTVNLAAGATISAYVYNNGASTASAFGSQPSEFRVWKVGP